MNVVLLTIDCLRADRVGFMGYDHGTTPFLDELATEGTVFEEAFATGPATTHSMPGLMTGTYPSWFGGYPPIPESTTTLAEAFRSCGYTTVGVHSNPWLSPGHRFDAGFDVYEDVTESGGGRSENGSPTRSSLATTRSRLTEMLKAQYYDLPASIRRVVSQGYFTAYYLAGRARDDAAVLVDRALEALDDRERDDFFLWLHFMDVHRPYTLPADDVGLGDVLQTARITRPAYTKPTPSDQRHISRIYDASVGYVDRQIERLYRELARRGVDEETLFVVTSDHGEEFGEHGDWFHRNFKLYDELLHVPLVVAGASVPSRRLDGLVSLVDVAPTVLERAGTDVPASTSGTSFADALDGETFSGRDEIIGEIYDPERDKLAVRSERWKLICDRAAERPERELYDVENDPREQHDLSTERDVPEDVLDEFREHLRRREATREVDMATDVENRLQQLGYLE